ncbi:hypothetical protein GGP46_003036 [Salinibacter ruber]|nr:hypothetical protein [Salinibacter ruber]
MTSSSRLSERRVRFLAAPPDLTQDPTDLRDVALGAKLLFDDLLLFGDLSDALSSPNLTPKSEVLRAFLQKRRELPGALHLGKFWRTARPWRRLEGLLASLAGLLHPLTSSTFTH